MVCGRKGGNTFCKIIFVKNRQILYLQYFDLPMKIIFFNLKKIEVKWNLAIFEIFRTYIRKFSIYFHEMFLVARFYRVLVVDIKTLILNNLVTLEMKVLMLAFFMISIFDLFAWAEAFNLEQWFNGLQVNGGERGVVPGIY